MRLWFSVATLLILACIILESAAAKAKRDSGDASKYRHKSSKPTEDHYSRDKLGHKNKARNEERNVFKKKEQHRNAGASEKIDSGEFLKEESNERDGKVNYEEKRGKLSQNKVIRKSKENVKNDRHADKIGKAKSKKNKRSADVEAPIETLDNDAGHLGGFKKNVYSNLDSASKKDKSKDKVTKKSECGIGKSVDSEIKDEFTANSDQVSNVKPPNDESTASASDYNDKRGKGKEFEKQKVNSKKIKKQEHSNNSNDLRKENMNLKRTEPQKEKNYKTLKAAQSDDQKIEETNDLPENSYYLNDDGLIKRKRAQKNVNVNERFSEKISESELECKPRKNDYKSTVPDAEIRETEKPEKYAYGTCNLKDDYSTEQSVACHGKSECFANDVAKSSIAGIKQDDDDDDEAKASENMDQTSGDENKERENSTEEENSNGEESTGETVAQEGISETE